ncbi:MAG TPA: hypothetical protein VMB84_08615 [Stellaceae bacterium]|nr:hypothetical protein [Stellaceae bacterium]
MAKRSTKPIHRVASHRMAPRGRAMGMSEGDRMTEQLNQQELARIQGGNMSAMPVSGGAMPPGGNMGGNMSGPSGGNMSGSMGSSGGMPAPGTGAPPPPK